MPPLLQTQTHLTEQWFSNLSEYQTALEGLWKHRVGLRSELLPQWFWDEAWWSVFLTGAGWRWWWWWWWSGLHREPLPWAFLFASFPRNPIDSSKTEWKILFAYAHYSSIFWEMENKCCWNTNTALTKQDSPHFSCFTHSTHPPHSSVNSCLCLCTDAQDCVFVSTSLACCLHVHISVSPSFPLNCKVLECLSLQGSPAPNAEGTVGVW